MTQNKEVSIAEKNRTIAEFMGSMKVNKEGFIDIGHMLLYVGQQGLRDHDLRYHMEWNWIMPVWIKFRSLPLDNKEFSEWVSSLFWYLYSSDHPERFADRLYYAITWYNTTGKK